MSDAAVGIQQAEDPRQKLDRAVIAPAPERRHRAQAFQAYVLVASLAFVALDIKSTQERKWRVGWSGRIGVAFRLDTGDASRLVSLQLQGYTGPAPYGQFYQENVRSVGVGVHFDL